MLLGHPGHLGVLLQSCFTRNPVWLQEVIMQTGLSLLGSAFLKAKACLVRLSVVCLDMFCLS